MDPKLIDANTLRFFKNELIKSDHIKQLYNNLLLNSCLFFILILALGITLYVRYTSKQQTTFEEAKQERITLLSKIVNLKTSVKSDESLITNLPKFETML
tara:strand:- start:5047 stop:5346 length:300 start_codon:yes stop_codon:yes gene_type:complete